MKRLLPAAAALTLAGTALWGAPPAVHAVSRAAIPYPYRYGVASLAPPNGKGSATGALVVVPRDTGLRLVLAVAHLRPRTTYSALIYSGSCGHTAEVQHILPNLTTDAQGRAVAKDTFVVQGIPANGWVISVPVAQKDPTKTPGTGVVCGNIHRPGVDIPLQQPAAGHIYTANGDLLVTRHIDKQGFVNASKSLYTEAAVYGEQLAPRQTFSVTIVSGRCAGPSKPMHHLPDLVSDAKGYAAAITYLSGSIPWVNMAVKVANAHGHVVACGNFPGYGVTQPAEHS